MTTQQTAAFQQPNVTPLTLVHKEEQLKLNPDPVHDLDLWDEMWARSCSTENVWWWHVSHGCCLCVCQVLCGRSPSHHCWILWFQLCLSGFSCSDSSGMLFSLHSTVYFKKCFHKIDIPDGALVFPWFRNLVLSVTRVSFVSTNLVLSVTSVYWFYWLPAPVFPVDFLPAEPLVPGHPVFLLLTRFCIQTFQTSSFYESSLSRLPVVPEQSLSSEQSLYLMDLRELLLSTYCQFISFEVWYLNTLLFFTLIHLDHNF